MAKWHFNFKAWHRDKLLEDSSDFKQNMELIEGKQFCMPAWEAALKRMRKHRHKEFEFTCECDTAVFGKVMKVLRHRERHKPMEHTHQCAANPDAHLTGYEDLDALPRPHCKLKFRFRILKYEEAGDYEKDIWAICDDHDRLSYIARFHAEGNQFYKDGKYEDARECYRKTVQIYKQMHRDLHPNSEDAKRIVRLYVPIILNYCQCLLQMKKDYDIVIKYCSEVIEVDKVTDNAKVFYRRAAAHVAVGNEEEASSDIKSCLSLDTSEATAKSCELLRKSLAEFVKKRDEELSERLKRAF